MSIMSRDDWLRRTTLPFPYSRSEKLKAIDNALPILRADSPDISRLASALNDWIESKGKNWKTSKRNQNHAVEDLVNQVTSRNSREPNRQVYETTNTIGTSMRYTPGSSHLSSYTLAQNIGTCAGMSAEFLNNLKTKRRPIETKPDLDGCAIKFQLCWQNNQDSHRTIRDTNKFNRDIIKKANLNPGSEASHLDHFTAFHFITKNPGYYYVDLREGHAVAAAFEGQWYFFDPNHGLWEYRTDLEFTIEVNQKLRIDGWTGMNGAWTCKV